MANVSNVKKLAWLLLQLLPFAAALACHTARMNIVLLQHVQLTRCTITASTSAASFLMSVPQTLVSPILSQLPFRVPCSVL